MRAVNALLTAGRGQRIAIIAGSGVGKSVLMGQMIPGAQRRPRRTAALAGRSTTRSKPLRRTPPAARAPRARNSSQWTNGRLPDPPA
ncbi:MAG TPA: hypothetical protein VNZ85_05220 [Caulobacter sp.]|nr:hypothetical protein [Caulobacter sp.]